LWSRPVQAYSENPSQNINNIKTAGGVAQLGARLPSKPEFNSKYNSQKKKEIMIENSLNLGTWTSRYMKLIFDQ
jgi:hypothetical protein